MTPAKTQNTLSLEKYKMNFLCALGALAGETLLKSFVKHSKDFIGGDAMKNIRTIAAKFWFIWAGLLWLLTSPVAAATVKLACSAKDTIGNAVKKLKPGDTLSVTGTCNENLIIPEETARIVLDGQGKATISGPDTAIPTIVVNGRGITIKGFTVTGGRDGIVVSRGGQAVIDRNTIQGTGRFGVQVNQSSFAVIVNNTIQNNQGNGITLGGSSYAVIGFFTALDKTASPNTIQNNGGNGISVNRSSNARITGNTIRNNKLNGVFVGRGSQADITSSTIDGNGMSGIDVSQNSSVQLGADKGTGIFESPNTTSMGNAQFGIRCTVNSSVDGRIGTLNGNNGAKEFDNSCVDSLEAVVLGKQQ
jgi:parallel beta-helix repeat protein